MKKKSMKILILLFIPIIIYVIYINNNNDNMIYLPLGDFLAIGVDEVGQTGHGYSDFVSEYLKKSGNLRFATKQYLDVNQTLNDIYKDIRENRKIEIDGKTTNIRRLLREASLVTVSAGLNDLRQIIDTYDGKPLDSFTRKKIIAEIKERLDNTISEIKKYHQHNIFIIGYHNIYIDNKERTIMIKKLNIMLREYAQRNNLIFIEINDLFGEDSIHIERGSHFYITKSGHRAISERIINQFSNNAS